MRKDLPATSRLLVQAERSFGRSLVIKRSINELRKSPDAFEEIVTDFDDIIKEMNTMFGISEQIDLNYFGSVAKLKSQLNEPLLSLEELSIQISGSEKPDILKTIMDTFSEIGNGLPAGGGWNWATKETPLVIASALLIEGYGRMLAKYKGDDTIKRNFVIGFEEIGWKKQKDSRIIRNVGKWLNDPEEIIDFSPGIQKELVLQSPTS